ncbi:MAG: MBL fold metallo-hydrolase [Armatimonadota bacterium]|nr:MBL fold metallo-hydrolase [Armatimonadota bacterium]MDR7588512.1 MBL fold metallo-hydrolase [Armatimonadota bacterium]MDR7612657.1 MBL fold metallo-hydrolase [Armatimonadota bacterium]
MRLTVLGKWSPYPPAGGSCPGYLVEAGGVRILLDCGSGVVAALHRVCTAFDLHAVVLTHLHPDHVTDIYVLRNELAYGRLPGPPAPPLPLFAPADAARALVAWLPRPESRREFAAGFHFRPLEEGAGEVSGVRLRFAPTLHPVPCHAVEVRAGGRRLVYTADTGPSAQVEEMARGCDLLLCEATLREADADLAVSLGHLTGSLAGSLAARAGARRLLLTHLHPRGDVQETQAAAAKEFAEAEVAQEGATYEV